LLATPLPPAEVALGLVALRGMLAEAGVLAERLRRTEARAAREAAEAEAETQRLLAATQAARSAAIALDRQNEEARRLQGERGAAERAALARAEEAIARTRSLDEALANLAREAAAAERQAAATEGRRLAAEQRRTDLAQREEARRAEAAGRRPEPPPPSPEPARPEPAATHAASAHAAGAPVAGTLVRGFASPGDGGPARGLTYATPAGARVTAPCGGQVAFAAPFRSFGRMVILDCGAGQHLVLAGLERLDVAMGHRVAPGEPVGIMPGHGRPSLYVELRRRGEPVDPRPFLR
ncbi:MAG TPA: peptidoglycan DD-metalloendopeptidase family protein, partial [Roseococcus sp.]|nr:peptidoglycan DD-metalloendopeptidase family protein [Roseococcus sp.]